MAARNSVVQDMAEIAPILSCSAEDFDGLRVLLRRVAESTSDGDVASRRMLLRTLDAASLLASELPPGASVVIDLTSCEFVHAASRAAALRAFVARFGADAPGWVFERASVGVGTIG